MNSELGKAAIENQYLSKFDDKLKTVNQSLDFHTLHITLTIKNLFDKGV